MWNIPANGGEVVQVARAGGTTVFEPPDGEFVYYVKAGGITSLSKVPVEGGEESQVLDSVGSLGCFAVVKEGIHFKRGPTRLFSASIHFYDFATGVTKPVATIERMVSFTVSPDGRSILYTRGYQADSDLMLVENFR